LSEQARSIRDRIKELRRVPARDLLANPRNWRRHPKAQQTALRAILAELGFAGALLAREMDGGRLMLIDGHLRASTTPDELVPVLVLDVTEHEANKILLTFDPLAGLATIDQANLAELTKLTPFDSNELFGLVHSLSDETPDFQPTSAEDQGRLDQKKKLSARNAAMNSRPELKLDWCDHAAAKYAVEHWHYSRSLPTPPIVRCGVWECGRFIGCVLFSRGASSHLLRPYGLSTIEGCELTRVALNSHAAPVSRIVAIATRMMRKQNPGLRLIISFADPYRGHQGGIYQAGGWLYAGQTAPGKAYLAPDGKLWHNRMISPTGVRISYGEGMACWRPEQCRIIDLPGKHRYLLPLDDEMRTRVGPLAQPYPKRREGDQRIET
jgi:hypothetical protein